MEILKPIKVQGIINKFCYVIGMIPSSYKLALTYEEQILAIGKYLEDTVYPAINNNAEALAELQTLFIDLQNYVNNYFDNLDVQTEINNKLDEMAESGELINIISEYLQINSILAFNNIASLKNADNLIDGSFTKIYGKTAYNDGFGAFYKIRPITNTDVVDDDLIVSLSNYPTLVAEKILENDYTIFVGDSYMAMNNNSLPTKIANYLKIRENNYLISAEAGSGFIRLGGNGNTYLTKLQSVIENIPDLNKVTRIIVLGGCNDEDYPSNQLIPAITAFYNYCHSQMPNAKMYLGMIGNFAYASTTGNTFRQNIYWNSLYSYRHNGITDIQVLDGVENIMKDYELFTDDEVHPNSNGIEELAKGVYNCIMYGSYNYMPNARPLSLSAYNNYESINITGNYQIMGKSLFINPILLWVTLTNKGTIPCETSTKFATGQFCGRVNNAFANLLRFTAYFTFVCNDGTNTTYQKVRGYIEVDTDNQGMSLYYYNEDGNHASISNITNISIRPDSKMIPIEQT